MEKYIVLFNPLSRQQKHENRLNKLKNKLIKNNVDIEIFNVLDIKDVDEFIKEIPSNSKIVIVGGDGTLHHFFTNLLDKEINHEFYLYKGGTGNDFVRSIKSKEKLIPLNPYLNKNAIMVKNNQKYAVVNCVGMGLDGLVCDYTEKGRGSKGRFNYFKHTLRAFKNYKPIDKIKFSVDGKKYEAEKVWMATIMNSNYFGGGMKLAPKQSRLDEKITLVVVNQISKFKLFLLFPFIYIGWHMKFSKHIKVYVGNKIELKTKNDTHFEVDGEPFIYNEISVIK